MTLMTLISQIPRSSDLQILRPLQTLMTFMTLMTMMTLMTLMTPLKDRFELSKNECKIETDDSLMTLWWLLLFYFIFFLFRKKDHKHATNLCINSKTSITSSTATRKRSKSPVAKAANSFFEAMSNSWFGTKWFFFVWFLFFIYFRMICCMHEYWKMYNYILK